MPRVYKKNTDKRMLRGTLRAARRSNRIKTTNKKCDVSLEKVNNPVLHNEIYMLPMLPKGYTAARRKELREYENSLFAGKKVEWNI